MTENTTGAASPLAGILGRLDALTTRLDMLERENQELRAAAGASRARKTPSDHPADPTSGAGLTRRSILRRSGGAVLAGAAVAASGLLGTKTASAASGDPVELGAFDNDSGSAFTGWSSTHPSLTLRLENDATGNALYAIAHANDVASIHARKNATGSGLFADVRNPNSTSPAILGNTDGQGAGVKGENVSDSYSFGVWGLSTGLGAGVYGEGPAGRGGEFKGRKAQIRLRPSGATTHPASGAAGDLFVDKSRRLWFCRGGTTWVRLV